MKKRIVICGVSGSIGLQSLKCLDNFELVGCSFNNNINLMNNIKERYPKIEVFSPNNFEINTVKSFYELIIKTKPDIVLNAIVGFNGLEVTKICLENNIDIALANKESLVCGGFLITEMLKNTSAKIYPVDSEHSSLYELFQYDNQNIETIYITASGGPFYNSDLNEIYNVDFNTAIKHPIWNMGYKISIDSATLINKCFEIIEAYYLYKKNIVAVYHPQAIVHSMVEFKNRSVISNMSVSDMVLSIDLAINKFSKSTPKINHLDFHQLNLYFEIIDPNKWLPIQWAYELINNHRYIIGPIVCILDDYLIECYKNNQIKFGDITQIINFYVQKYKLKYLNSWDELFNFQQQLILEVKQYINNRINNAQIN